MTPKNLQAAIDFLQLGKNGTHAHVELAALLGVTREAVRRYLRGDRGISRQVGMSVVYLKVLKSEALEGNWPNVVEYITRCNSAPAKPRRKS